MVCHLNKPRGVPRGILEEQEKRCKSRAQDGEWFTNFSEKPSKPNSLFKVNFQVFC